MNEIFYIKYNNLFRLKKIIYKFDEKERKRKVFKYSKHKNKFSAIRANNQLKDVLIVRRVECGST